MNFITQFIKGNWLGKARLYTFNPRKMKILLLQLGFYLTKTGLSSAKETLVLMRDYLHDVTTGKYKDYELAWAANQASIELNRYKGVKEIERK